MGLMAAWLGCRTSLPPDTPARRAAVHQLATHYGLASQSFGQEPNRHIDLFKACPVQGMNNCLSDVDGFCQESQPMNTVPLVLH